MKLHVNYFPATQTQPPADAMQFVDVEECIDFYNRPDEEACLPNGEYDEKNYPTIVLRPDGSMVFDGMTCEVMSEGTKEYIRNEFSKTCQPLGSLFVDPVAPIA